jgi:hypothetical protein
MSDRSSWMRTEATVYISDENETIRPGLVTTTIGTERRVVFSYTVDGQYYSGEFSGKMKEGEKFTLLYNPANPEENEKVDRFQKFSDFTDSVGGKLLVYGVIAIGLLLDVLYKNFIRK